jgi:hypothetical protein
MGWTRAAPATSAINRMKQSTTSSLSVHFLGNYGSKLRQRWGAKFRSSLQGPLSTGGRLGEAYGRRKTPEEQTPFSY